MRREEKFTGHVFTCSKWVVVCKKDKTEYCVHSGFADDKARC